MAVLRVFVVQLAAVASLLLGTAEAAHVHTVAFKASPLDGSWRMVNVTTDGACVNLGNCKRAQVGKHFTNDQCRYYADEKCRVLVKKGGQNDFKWDEGFALLTSQRWLSVQSVQCD
ncbi:hypothetical protein GGTG_02299 [Gaeumannomyces tritici R3-111a-1]|uniref:Cyanovirin-N domain-containing protein n=1 Tax=Gaeumannomyces tritici (strain R3-111a-1) TaxID=644352 RepID=J3NLZ4_GAET3|nr:hypothetical protein GGTG_02299 [Gaeumannomyces tritici R3-111a-1]EJT82325.1 hypothetical protein GGTG_02299 [Gaeumannomyces tritici R3-111a-1]